MQSEVKIPLGMPTLLEMPRIGDCAKLCRQLGLQFVELNMNLPEYQAGLINERDIDFAQKEYGVFCTIHLDERFDACDFNPNIRDAYLRTMRYAITLAGRHNMPVINMHMGEGVSFKLPGGAVHLYDQYIDVYLDSIRQLRQFCEEAIGDSGTMICLENTNGFPVFAQRGIELLLESPVFGLTVDIGHAYCAGGKDDSFLQAHENRIHHMHIHDAKDEKCHLPIGSGALDIGKALQTAKTHGCTGVIEVKSIKGLYDSADALDALLAAL